MKFRGPEVLGSRLRHLLEQLDGGVAAIYADLGFPGFRQRFTPIIRALAVSGPSTIRELAGAIGVTHSAVSQTIVQMVKDDLVVRVPGEDARERIIRLTPKAERLLPVLETEWEATKAAAIALEAELPFPLSRLIDETLAALDRRSMHGRIRDALPARPGREMK